MQVQFDNPFLHAQNITVVRFTREPGDTDIDMNFSDKSVFYTNHDKIMENPSQVSVYFLPSSGTLTIAVRGYTYSDAVRTYSDLVSQYNFLNTLEKRELAYADSD